MNKLMNAVLGTALIVSILKAIVSFVANPIGELAGLGFMVIIGLIWYGILKMADRLAGN